MSLTVNQHTNLHGFPKSAELIEITGAHALEASDRAIFNQLLQIAHDSERLAEADAEWEITLATLRKASSKHESNDRVRESLRRLRRTEVKVTYMSARTGKKRVMETHYWSSPIQTKRNPGTAWFSSEFQNAYASCSPIRTDGDASGAKSPTQ